MTGGGGSLDVDGIAELMEFYARAGIDGILALGTTGEGILLSLDERSEHIFDARAAIHIECVELNGKLFLLRLCSWYAAVVPRGRRDCCSLLC